STYKNDKPEELKSAIESMLSQTVLPDQFVLVCDGPVGEGLEAVITGYEKAENGCFTVVRLEKNSGLGNALNEGLKHCRNELVARMDADDISVNNRCELQLKAYEAQPEIALLSGTVQEFCDDINVSTGSRKVPESYEEILSYSKKRTPFNHPCMMFKKSAVVETGGYSEEYHLFEDYHLWVRMLMKGYKAANLRDVLLYMRTPADMYKRRGGKKYADDMLRFHKWLKSTGYTNQMTYLTGAVPHAVVCVLPNGLRKLVYKILH
ncbi:MAG: glycosyltransferase, partial [Parasporobacterium sp.]|nr:glycosyltransferase [Parasporobacterium sp.]